MKVLNKVFQFLAIALGLSALVLFFLKFATLTLSDGNTVSLIGAQLGFGAKKAIGETSYDMARSADILFCFWLTVIGLVFSVFSFKAKLNRYLAAGIALADGIYMLVIALSNPLKFVDARPLSTLIGVTSIKYSVFVPILAACTLAFAVFAIAYLFMDDYLEAKASKGAKKTIIRRVIGFFKDYKSETKKIVWPGFKDVLKNTAVVLVMCLLVGALIWLVDFGLGKLLELILSIK